MNCAFDKEKLTAFYDGELDAAGKTEVERHISSCSECLRDLGEIKSASLLVKELPRPRAPRSIAEGVSREIAATGRVHSFSKARSMVLWATAAAAGLFIVANVIFLAGGPAAEAPMAKAVRPDARPEPMVGGIPAPGADEKKQAPDLDDRKEVQEKGANREVDRTTFGQKAAKEGELAESRKKEEADAKPRAEEKLKEMAKAADPAKPAPPPAPVAPAPKPSAAPPAPPAAAAEPKHEALGAPIPPPALVLNVTSSEMAKVRPRVEEIVRKYAERSNSQNKIDRGQQLEQERALNELKRADEKSAARRQAETGAITLDLTPSEYEQLKKEIEQAGGVQLAWAAPADGRLRGGGKGGAPETEGNARTGGGQAGGLASKTPSADYAQRKAAEPTDKETLAKKDLQTQAPGNPQQKPVQNAPAEAPAPRDQNAPEEPRRIQAGETRIRIVINFLEVPVAEKK